MGYNQSLTQLIYLVITYKPLIVVVHGITEICNFLYFPVLFSLLLLVLFILLRANKKTAIARGILYTKCTSLFVLNMIFAVIIFEVIKRYFEYPRPYCTLSFNLQQYLLYLFSYSKKECYSSFPSFHAAYACLFVASFWNILSKNLKIMGVVFTFIIGISRVMLAKHFVADVVYAYLIALAIINPLSNFLISKYFPRYKFLVEKILKKVI